ncbi:hypothetical protein VKT23_015253 [Stygiomarasmius scandens]|uniref:Uncharacterized protein n=1 Tax=Marasmiellus scandens TaxID=2682957 RepID=A0ABR1IYF4_9AGAR
MNASIDLGSLVREIRESILVVRDNQTREEEKINHARLIVYRSLALNPALGCMQPPSGEMADTDFYEELYMPDWTASTIFYSLAGYDHFKRAGSLGDVGKRARIMMLLLWINGHRLNKDKIRMLVSTVIEDGLRSQRGSDHIPSESEVTALDSVNSIIKSLADMIKNRVPLPEDFNPFKGSDFREGDEKKSLSREGLWIYNLPEDQRYELDVWNNPICLLRPCARVIVPQTKLSLLLIQWSVHNFGLGKKVSQSEDIDPKAFWNALTSG